MSDFITGGYLAQLVLLTLVWGTIAFQVITGRPIPDALLDMGFVIVGFYFHAAATDRANKITSDK